MWHHHATSPETTPLHTAPHHITPLRTALHYVTPPQMTPHLSNVALKHVVQHGAWDCRSNSRLWKELHKQLWKPAQQLRPSMLPEPSSWQQTSAVCKSSRTRSDTCTSQQHTVFQNMLQSTAPALHVLSAHSSLMLTAQKPRTSCALFVLETAKLNEKVELFHCFMSDISVQFLLQQATVRSR